MTAESNFNTTDSRKLIMRKIDKPRAPKRLDTYDRELRGPSQNRWGGQRTQRLRTYGGKFGKANDGRSLTVEEVKQWQRENKNHC
jgi:hypothetical protein